MSATEAVDACIKVVSNRCRNLRKAIERAKVWAQTEQDGQELNEEQRATVKSLERKEALLAELQEILRKQTSIVQPQVQPESTESGSKSKRTSKAARAAKTRETKKAPESNPSTNIAEAPKDESTLEAQAGPKTDSDVPVSEKSNAAAETLPRATEGASLDLLRRELEELKVKQSQEILLQRKDAVRKTLNLFHVVDFLRQEGSREALLAYFSSAEGKRSPRLLSGLDMDLLCYFNVMLTSPNGNVPHHDAVDVSTSHCLHFLDNSDSEAFKGTSYATLTDIVMAIASCRILTDRGTGGDGARNARGTSAGENNNNTQIQAANGTEPGHLVSNAAAEGPMS